MLKDKNFLKELPENERKVLRENESMPPKAKKN